MNSYESHLFGRNSEEERQKKLPLYKRDKIFQSLQIMDKDTLLHLRSQTEIPLININTLHRDYEPFLWKEAEKFIPEKEWFSKESHYDGIHGVNHLTRVLLNARMLAQIQGLSEQETKVVSVAAGIHDMRREDDRTDNEHGLRAGNWIRQNYELMEERGIDLNPEEVENVFAICEAHELPYENVSEETKQKYGRTLDVLMHADMMDRYRLYKTKWWPQDKYVRLENVKDLLNISKYNCLTSEGYILLDNMGSQGAIKKAALETGVLRDSSDDIDKSGNEEEIRGSRTEVSAREDPWVAARSLLNRLVQLKNGHTLSPLNVEKFPIPPLNRTIYGKEISNGVNPLANLFENDPISQEIDPIEVAWQHYLIYGTPNGHLFKDNRLFDQVKQGDGLTLVHATPSLDKIMQDGKFYPSGGCLGASVYTVPLRTDEKAHNLTKFIIEQQIPNNPDFIKNNSRVDLLLFDVHPESFMDINNEANWLDYLRFGEMQGKIFEQQVKAGGFTVESIDKINGQIKTQVEGAREFLNICLEYNLDEISDEKFEKEFAKAQNSLPILGYAHFESLLEYIALHQDDKKSQMLAQQGELNTFNYYKTVYDLCPQLNAHWKLQNFRPTLKEIADYLQEQSSQGEMITNFSEEHFYTFMKWRIGQQVRRKIMGSRSLPNEGADIFDYMRDNPSLTGHIIHRDLRKDPKLREQHGAYENERAEELWSYWTDEKILTPFNALLPKGEIGLNPRFPNLRYSVYRGIMDSDGRIMHGDKLDIHFEDKIAPPELSTLRIKGDSAEKTD